MAKFTNWRRHFNHEVTSLQGYIHNISHKEIISVLGMGEGTSDKVKDSWGVKDSTGIIATIYDWKNYNEDLSEVTHWHIGGEDSKAVELIRKIFPNARVTKF